MVWVGVHCSGVPSPKKKSKFHKPNSKFLGLTLSNASLVDIQNQTNWEIGTLWNCALSCQCVENRISITDIFACLFFHLLNLDILHVRVWVESVLYSASADGVTLHNSWCLRSDWFSKTKAWRLLNTVQFAWMHLRESSHDKDQRLVFAYRYLNSIVFEKDIKILPTKMKQCYGKIWQRI